MHRAVIFRMKGKCTLLKSALSWQVLLNSKFETWSSILDHRDSRLDPRDSRLDPGKFGESRIESWVSTIKTRVTVNLHLSGAVTPSNSMVLNHFPKCVTFDTEIKPSKYPAKKGKIVAQEKWKKRGGEKVRKVHFWSNLTWPVSTNKLKMMVPSLREEDSIWAHVSGFSLRILLARERCNITGEHFERGFTSE